MSGSPTHKATPALLLLSVEASAPVLQFGVHLGSAIKMRTVNNSLCI